MSVGWSVLRLARARERLADVLCGVHLIAFTLAFPMLPARASLAPRQIHNSTLGSLNRLCPFLATACSHRNSMLMEHRTDRAIRIVDSGCHLPNCQTSLVEPHCPLSIVGRNGLRPQ